MLLRSGNYFRIFYYVGFLILLQLSCKKSDKTVYPDANILEPLENSQFQIHDTIFVKAVVSAADGLVNGRLSVVDQNFVSVNNALSFSLSGNSQTINSAIVLSNENIATGTYFISLLVNGNSEDVIAYRQIAIEGIPKVREGMIAVSSTGTDYHTWQVMNDGTRILRHSATDVFCCLESNARFRLLYTCPAASGALKAMHASDFSTAWEIPAIPVGGAPYFTRINYSNDLLFVSYHDRSIRGFDFLGAQKFFTLSEENTFPVCTKVFGNYLLAGQHDISGPGKKIKVYVLSSGAPWQEIDTDIDVVDFFQRSDGRYYAAGNFLQDGKFYEYNFNTNTLHLLHVFTGDSIKSIVELEPSRFLIATQSQVYTFDAISNQASQWLNEAGVVSLDYDPLNEQVIYCSGNQLKVVPLQSPTTALISSQFNGAVLSAKAIYNRE